MDWWYAVYIWGNPFCSLLKMVHVCNLHSTDILGNKYQSILVILNDLTTYEFNDTFWSMCFQNIFHNCIFWHQNFYEYCILNWMKTQYPQRLYALPTPPKKKLIGGLKIACLMHHIWNFSNVNFPPPEVKSWLLHHGLAWIYQSIFCALYGPTFSTYSWNFRS